MFSSCRKRWRPSLRCPRWSEAAEEGRTSGGGVAEEEEEEETYGWIKQINISLRKVEWKRRTTDLNAQVRRERRTDGWTRERGEERVSVCDSIPEFMSFVSLDCTYTGRNIDHSGTQSLFIFIACLYLYFYIFTVYFDKFDVDEVSLLQSGSFSLFTVYMWRCDFTQFVFQLFLSLSRFFFSYIGWLTTNLPTERVSFGSFRPVKTKVVTLKDKIMDVETNWNEIFLIVSFCSCEFCCWR